MRSSHMSWNNKKKKSLLLLSLECAGELYHCLAGFWGKGQFLRNASKISHWHNVVRLLWIVIVRISQCSPPHIRQMYTLTFQYDHRHVGWTQNVIVHFLFSPLFVLFCLITFLRSFCCVSFVTTPAASWGDWGDPVQCSHVQYNLTESKL